MTPCADAPNHNSHFVTLKPSMGRIRNVHPEFGDQGTKMEMYGGLELRKFVAPECVFGINARHLAANYAINLGARKVLVVTDPGIVAAGWTSDVLQKLEDAGVPYAIFSDVTPNPKAEEVMAGADVYRAEGCNCIIAVGGGSPQDCAKGIGIVSTNKRHISEFEGVDEVHIPIPPLICIPTTGSAAEVSQFAIITDEKVQRKLVIVSKAIVPDAALIDPIMFTTMPHEIAADTGVDALTHAFEAYVSNAQSALTDLFALEAIRLITTYLPASLTDPQNVELQSKVSSASLCAGLAFSNAGLGLIHAMAHGLSGLRDTPHGLSITTLLPEVIAFNFPVAGERYRRIGETMGLDVAGVSLSEVQTALTTRLRELLKSMEIEHSMREIGINKNDIPALAAKAMEDPDIATTPREPTLHDIEEIYERAF